MIATPVSLTNVNPFDKTFEQQHYLRRVFIRTCVCNLFYDQDALWRRRGLLTRRALTQEKSPASQVACLLDFLKKKTLFKAQTPTSPMT